MAEPPRRPPSATRLPVVREEVVQRTTSQALPTATAVPRKQTPIGMPAPPPGAIPDSDRRSRDDLEHLADIDRLERSRAELLVKNQDLEQENRLLREIAPTQIFPPPSIPPSDPRPKSKVEVASSIPPSKKYQLSQRLMHLATGLGIFVAIAWNAFNSYRSAPEKVEALSAQAQQSKRQREDESVRRALGDRRNLEALRALHCYAKQLRGASARQGLDLPSLPPGGVKALRLADDDPNRPGPPKFVAEEVCPKFPELPPDISLP